jgi:hypothetical protein
MSSLLEVFGDLALEAVGELLLPESRRQRRLLFTAVFIAVAIAVLWMVD